MFDKLVGQLRQHWFFNLVQLGGAVWAVLWWRHLPVPGYAIGVLAVLAAVMSFHIDVGMKPWQKAAWMLLIGAFLVLEFRAIDKDRTEYAAKEAAKNEQETSAFRSIADGIKAAIAESDQNFATTMGRTNQVLKSVTGGDAFAYVVPQNFSGDRFPGLVWNNGEQALVGLTLTIAHTSDPIPVWGAAFFKPIFIGTVAPHDHAPIPDFIFQPVPSRDSGQDNYWIMLSAQNGTAQQSLYFRRNKLRPDQWAYSFTVTREHYSEKPQPKKMQTKIDNRPRPGPKYELLLFRAWTDDMEAKALQKP